MNTLFQIKDIVWNSVSVLVIVIDSSNIFFNFKSLVLKILHVYINIY